MSLTAHDSLIATTPTHVCPNGFKVWVTEHTLYAEWRVRTADGTICDRWDSADGTPRMFGYTNLADAESMF